MKRLEGWREGSPRVDGVQTAILWAPGSATQPPLSGGWSHGRLGRWHLSWTLISAALCLVAADGSRPSGSFASPACRWEWTMQKRVL